ncbi:efflux RND transporter permease subunit [Pseudooceanicola sp. CBS1P-1]|uniref:Efflux pump membrane transporter n=1 Tax=Pseudooceanicola albus TaxID=2692189 RepID=A0A6L7G403_9RHOB|nr:MULTISPECIES: efflux RND transporter permease subunit [Pseudooceanicola]MBT9384536.1 efflux RND transporter permease subunit [Pseudooceanicola endophyticus]MXN18238.1 efflux RND transporter permease subunit [Pseudooceanicola albus]
MVRFFIHRPVFAWVLALVTILAGAFAYTQLPVSQYPEIAPTTIRITATYSGATADAVQNSVTSTIEDALTGIDGMLYMESSSRQGSSRVTLTFDGSIDPIDAQNEVQVKVSSVESQLPDAVVTSGVKVSRSSDSILMVGAIVSTDGRYSTVELGDIITNMIEGPVQRTTGVGGINIFGSGYAMRIWLDPLKLAQYQLTPADVTTAVSNQNTTVSVGSLGDLPTTEGQQFTATITAQSQLTSAEQFEQILLKTESDGSAVYLGDVARVEIGQEDYGVNSFFNGENAAGFGVNLAAGANAIDTAEAVRATLKKLAPALPEGVEVHYAYDTSPFVQLSIEKVYHTLGEAVLLVLLVILVFLQKWRATIIPIIAVPVVLMGTFAVLAAMGYTINTLTMFAMVLAIGLLVDDAIVVVENVERVMEEEGLDPLPATEKSMGQITGALIGIALVLSAVFLPMAFMGGSTGVIYRQFSVTIITAMVLSALVALILSPALCATMLRRAHGRAIAPARWFNRNFDRMSHGYGSVVRRFLKAPVIMLVVLAGVGFAASQVYKRIPSSFLPSEDQGVLMVIVSLTEGSTTAQTKSVVEKIDDWLKTDQAASVDSSFATLGFGFGGSGQNSAMVFVKLKDFDERTGANQSASAVAAAGNREFGKLRAGRVFFMQPPAIPGMGNTSGFSMYLVDQANNGSEAMIAAAKELETMVQKDGRAQNLRISGDESEAVLRINIDQQKAESFGVTPSTVNSLLSTIFTGKTVNDFDMNGNLRPVIVQADAPYRMQPEDIDDWFAINSDEEMVPFSAFMTTKWVSASPTLSRIGGTNAMSISGSAADGVSSGEAMNAMEELVGQLDGGYGVAWTGISYQEQQSGNQAPYLYALSVLVVFLSLAALYESWSIPFSVMLAVPVGILGALVAAWVAGGDNDVYFKVGILTTIGLAAKNAILIVEFAKDLEAGGKPLVAATIEAAKMRLRPILMTSFAFILGVVPLAVATGAGAAAQNAIGIGVLGGMIAATFIGVFMVPSFYVLIRRISDRSVRSQPR